METRLNVCLEKVHKFFYQNLILHNNRFELKISSIFLHSSLWTFENLKINSNNCSKNFEIRRISSFNAFRNFKNLLHIILHNVEKFYIQNPSNNFSKQRSNPANRIPLNEFLDALWIYNPLIRPFHPPFPHSFELKTPRSTP